MSKLKLFDVQRSSFVDGPGVRTTVFFRGCNLKCKWCHNPESQSGEKRVLFYKEKCLSCGRCNAVCPEKAIAYGVVDYSKCTFCGKCSAVCSATALRLCGFDADEDEVLSKIMADRLFYGTDGGATFSGGECMLYPDEVASLARKCKQAGISVAVDTAGCVPWSSFACVLPYVDLFLYDIKTLNEEKHKRYVGCDNALIIENLKKLLSCGKRVIIRVPVIPGVNDEEEDMLAIKRLLAPYKDVRVELLPYHKMGENKYAALGIKAHSFPVPDLESMKKLKDVFN